MNTIYSLLKIKLQQISREVNSWFSRGESSHMQAEEALHQSEERLKLMSWVTKDAVRDWNLRTNQVWWGEGLQKIFHYSPNLIETNADWWFQHIHPNDVAKVKSTINQALEGGMEFWSKEYRFQRKDGTYADVIDRGYILRDSTGTPYQIVGAIIDITDRKQAEQALLESEARYRQIVETAGDLIYRVDRSGRLTYINPTALRIMGFKSEEGVLGHHYLEFVQPAWRERVKFTYHKQFKQRASNTYFEFLALTRQRREIWLGQTVQIVMDNSRVIGFHAVGRDITAQKEADTALQASNYKMRQVLNELQDRNHEIVLLNEMSSRLQACRTVDEAYRIIADLAKQMFRGTVGALYLFNSSHTTASAVVSWGGLLPSELVFTSSDCCSFNQDQSHSHSENQTTMTCLHLSKPLPAVSYCLPIYVQSEILGVLHIRSEYRENLSESKRQLAFTVVEQVGMDLSNLKLREALLEQSIRDALTGLYNRRYKEEVLQQQLSHVTRQAHPLGIVMIDIDHFKRFNDAYGHAAGDTLLRALGRFLQSNIRHEDIACRYGGEEFTLIMPGASLDVAQQRAGYLWNEIRQLQVPNAGGFYKGITLSLGVAIYPLHGYNVETVLHAADSALYRAKEEGRNRIVIAEKAV